MTSLTSEVPKPSGEINSASAKFVNYPSVDWVVCIVVFGVGWWLSQKNPEAFGLDIPFHIEAVRDLESDTRRAVFQTVTTLCGTLLGLTLTSISILASLMKEDLTSATGGILTPARKKRVSSLFFAGLRGLALATLGSMALMIVASDSSRASAFQQGTFFAILVLVASRLTRLIWLLSLTLAVSVSATAPGKQNPPIGEEEYF